MVSNFDYVSDLVFNTAIQFSDLRLTYPQLVIALIVDSNQCEFLVPTGFSDAKMYMEALRIAVDKLASKLIERGLLFAEKEYQFVLVKRTIKLCYL